jgi:hypothetical protein
MLEPRTPNTEGLFAVALEATTFHKANNFSANIDKSKYS